MQDCGTDVAVNNGKPTVAHASTLREWSLAGKPLSTREEIELQKSYDAERTSPQAVVAARARGLAETHRAVSRREPGSYPAFRQGLIDLAAACELAAEQIDLEGDPFRDPPEPMRVRV
jgi:hypothetical protein